LSYALLPSQEIEDLAFNNKYLKDLNEEFIELSNNKKWKMMSFCEKFSSYVGYNLWVQLVHENSAKLPSNLSDFLVLDTDHFYICKPDNKNSVIYKSALNLINNVYSQYIDERVKERQIFIKYDKSYFYENYFFKELAI
jgi:hypothetical protein